MGVAGLETASLQMEAGTGCVPPSFVGLSGPNPNNRQTDTEKAKQEKGDVNSYHLSKFNRAGETRCHLKCISAHESD